MQLLRKNMLPSDNKLFAERFERKFQNDRNSGAQAQKAENSVKKSEMKLKKKYFE